jgi:hypothetical protein
MEIAPYNSAATAQASENNRMSDMWLLPVVSARIPVCGSPNAQEPNQNATGVVFSAASLFSPFFSLASSF